MKTYNEFTTQTKLNEAARASLLVLESFDEDEISKINLPESIEQADLNEAIMVVPLIIGLILAAPAIIELLAKGFKLISKAISKLKSSKDESSTTEDKIIEFAEKWHKVYINIIVKILQISGIYKSAKITSASDKKKAAEVVFFTIVFGFAVFGGVATVKGIAGAIQNSPSLANLSGVSLEGILTAIKSNEVKTFISKLTSL